MRIKFILLIASLFFISCQKQNDQNKREFLIGFSQCTTGDSWRKFMNEEMRREIGLFREYDLELVIKDARNNNEKQKEDIRELLRMGMDLLIVSPNEAEPLTSVVGEIHDQGIPVIVIDRKINSDKFTAYIGADNLAIGRAAGNYAINLLDNGGTILEITGLDGSTPAIERSGGFRDIIDGHQDIEITKVIEGRWLHDLARKKTDSLFYRDRSFDLVYAHNDRMAYGTYLSARKNHYKPFILGVDGLNIPDGGIDLVLNETLDATFLYPTGGDKAIQLAIKVLTGASYNKINILNTTTINHTNARILKLQGEQIIEQNNKIDRQLAAIDDLTGILKKRNTFLWMSLASIFLLVIVVGLVFSFLRQKEKVNKTLAANNSTIERQNKKINRQKDHMIQVMKMSEESTELKLRFFTNISHEFRSMLSLIIHPLEEMIAKTQEQNARDQLLQIQQRTERLLRLSDEIQSFRKLDKQKYLLHFQSGNLGSFIIKILEMLKKEASEHHQSIKSEVPENLIADYDSGVIEKVMYNLITNAIKYTPSGGTIKVKVNIEKESVLIRVEDNGRGISHEDLPYVFDRFYRQQHDNEYELSDGSGIGLAMTKELIQLHEGEISVESKPGKGSVFRVRIPRFHVQPAKKTEKNNTDRVPNTRRVIPVDKNIHILIVEDNREIRSVIGKSISKYYAVLTAENGETGFEMARQKQPDLIVSDILMPVKDGIEMCREIKNHHLTFHIPVILLSALDSQESIIQGFDTGADAYMTKPFNESILISRIYNLLESRKKLKESLGKSFFLPDLIKNRENREQHFIQRCIDIINQNAKDESFKISDLADSMSMSRSSLFRKIKEITGLKTVDFIKKIKLQYAYRLLLNEDLTIAEVAWQSGFSDSKYFSKVFTQEFGKTPSRFREISRAESDRST